ncbi:hypothetical protein CCR75_003407 [Bremia lactucae]|uniref:Uncharacterized protein n=1 Tax=Bremia lactucae TaxID=4779 RepID=A0A976IIF1_BRELC|nr:hypothetical protein CCR75_003407 [Bremia lactucae]
MSRAAASTVLTNSSLFRHIMRFIDGVPGRILSCVTSFQAAHCSDPWSVAGALPKDAIQRGDLDTLRHLWRLSRSKSFLAGAELSFRDTILYAIQNGRLAIVQYLASIKLLPFKFSLMRSEEDTLMGWAIRYSDVPTLQDPVEIITWVAAQYPNSKFYGIDADDLSRAGLSVLQYLDERKMAPKAFQDSQLVDYVAKMGRLEIMKFLLQRQGEEHQRCTSNAMDGAASNGFIRTVQYLHDQRSEGCTVAAMDRAAANGYIEVVHFLHTQRREGCTIAALDRAAINGHLDLVQFLHTHRQEGCSTDAMDGAAAGGFIEIVRFLHTYRNEGCTTRAMDRAARSGHIDTVMFLHQHRREGCTTEAMDGAALAGHLSIVKFLQEHRREGGTSRAVDGAAWRGHLDVVKYLLKHRKEGCTSEAMDVACQNGNLNMVRALHEQGQALCTTDAMNNAASRGHLDIVRYLQEHRVEGCTKDAMTNAAINGHTEIVLFLGEHRHEGPHDYALERAAARGNLECVEALIRCSILGCLIEARNAAHKAGYIRVVSLLTDWINPDVQSCSLSQFHKRPGPRWCQRQPEFET